ncbi:hypothetical protein [Ramlibacter albus]|uniref:Uncharacterized protein n=1 Tax=Ramlibacter albus TaxID=2079448 RepID=A0A923S5F2_9BURK|nr:hypothetical protein [Ramlibacter albus]MBC5768471.1 hypothetical protein [Ramlibacter albus]
MNPGLTRVLSPLVFCAALVAGCGGGGPDAEPVASTDAVSRINGAYAPATYVFRNQGELSAAWSPAPQLGQTTTDSPTYDFSTSMIVGVSLGTGIRCYIPTITKVVRSGNTMTVSWKSGAPNGPTTLACLHSWPLNAFVSVPQHSGTVEFVRVDS